jgi:predicted nucleic acid-binding protein
VAEFFSGVAVGERLAAVIFLSAFNFWPISPEAAQRAGGYRFAFARRGIQLGTPDTLTAAVAGDYLAVLVTRNARHYPMTDLLIQVL